MMGGTYVVAAVVALALLIGAHEVGYRRGGETGKANLTAYIAQAEEESAKLRAKAAEVRVEVVTQYRDRIKEIRVPTPVEVVREIEVIRNSGCVLPPEFRVLHDRATSSGGEAPAGADAEAAPVDCASAIETIRENYARALENTAQLEALQKWAASVSEP
jgi:hypothetical protein